MKKSSARIGIIHAYPGTYLIKSLQKVDCKIVLFVPNKLAINNDAIEAVVEIPLYDPSLVVKKVLEYHQEKPFDALLSVYEGATAITAKAAELLKLPGSPVNAAQASRNKYLAYTYWLKQGIPVPITIPLDEPALGWQEIEAKIGYPAIIKLADSMNSQGVIKVNCRDDYHQAIEYLVKMLEKPRNLDLQTDRNRWAYGTSEVKIIAQEYCPGIEVGVDCLLAKGNAQILGIFEKAPARGPYFAESMSVSPSSLGHDEVDKVSKIAIEAALALSTNQISAAHVEIRFTAEGPKVLEAGLRPGGAYTVAAMEYQTGINAYRELLSLLLDNPLSVVKPNGKAALYGGIVIPQSGVLKNASGLEIFDNLDELLDVQILNQPGDRVYCLPESAQPHFAYYLVGGDSREEVIAKHRLIQEQIHLEISH